MSTNTKSLTVLPRPRSHWQAMDAGMLLARGDYVRLVLVWLLFAIPVVLLSSVLLLFDISLYWILLINWWFKPLYELPQLLLLSKSIFGQTVTIKEIIVDTKSRIPALLRSYLTLSRLSPSRSLTAPVVFLEGLKGQARSKRVSILTAETTRAYTLMVAWLNVEGIAYYALLAAALTLSPIAYTDSELLALFTGQLSKMDNSIAALFLLLPTLIAALVSPMYVGAGFLLYINRRMRLEAWDIEHQFQALEARLQSKSTIGASKTPLRMIAWASLMSFFIVSASAPVSSSYAQSNKRPTVSDVRNEVRSIYESDDFGSEKTVEKLRFINNKNDPDNELNTAWVSVILEALVAASRAVVYLAAGAILIVVIWALLKFTPSKWSFSRRPELTNLDVEHHPLTRSLPQDIAEHALAALNANNPREAISLLYRGALATIMRRHELSIPESATEAECQKLVDQCNNPPQTLKFNQITNKWSQTAYANHIPTHAETLELIELWKAEFSHRAGDEYSRMAT